MTVARQNVIHIYAHLLSSEFIFGPRCSKSVTFLFCIRINLTEVIQDVGRKKLFSLALMIMML